MARKILWSFFLAHRHKLGENEVDLALETLDQMGHLAVHRLVLEDCTQFS